MQNDCAEIKIRAERRAGELLGEMERHSPTDGRPEKVLHDASLSRPTLKQLGIEETQSHRWQRLAQIEIEVSSLKPVKLGRISRPKRTEEANRKRSKATKPKFHLQI